MDDSSIIQLVAGTQALGVFLLGWVMMMLRKMERKIVACPNGRCCQCRYPVEGHTTQVEKTL